MGTFLTRTGINAILGAGAKGGQFVTTLDMSEPLMDSETGVEMRYHNWSLVGEPLNTGQFLEEGMVTYVAPIDPLTQISLQMTSYLTSDTNAPCYLTSVTVQVYNGSTSTCTNAGVDVYVATNQTTSGWTWTSLGGITFGTVAAGAYSSGTVTGNAYIAVGLGQVKVDFTSSFGTKTSVSLGTVLEK